MNAKKETSLGDLTVGSIPGSSLTQFSATDVSPIVPDTITVGAATGSADISVAVGASAETIAALVNQAGTGVTASALTAFVLGADDVGANTAAFKQGTTYSFQIATDIATPPSSYQTVSFTVGGAIGAGGVALTSADQLNAAATAFNDVAGKTGFNAKIVTTDNGFYGIQLTNEVGKDLRIGNVSDATSNPIALDDLRAVDGDDGVTGSQSIPTTLANTGTSPTWTGGAWVSGQVTFDSDKSFSLISASTTGGPGFFTSVGLAGSQLQTVTSLDVSTVESATRTLATADAALSVISGQRAKFGALQSRFETSIANLQTNSENLSASRSRIMDADFAMETANLSRAQILQQAGTAMVAQANQLPQAVLQLLQR